MHTTFLTMLLIIFMAIIKKLNCTITSYYYELIWNWITILYVKFLCKVVFLLKSACKSKQNLFKLGSKHTGYVGLMIKVQER